MSEEKKESTEETKFNESTDGQNQAGGPSFGAESSSGGPAFEQSPDPLAGVKKAGGDAWKATEGRTVSMRVYIGSIAAVIILMLLARCGG